ncbi:hypothetical protein SAY86_016330 [Trapa natans]|uniref:Uncharacterized protein n=1 Tax=Trapa natans TaxID=22666 RepID=A0AAN7LFV8_TRANT|nr:hypothetical protein SAY86_016330 [Trapa natans]
MSLSVVSPSKGSVVAEIQKQLSDFFAQNSTPLTKEMDFNGHANRCPESFFGSLEELCL